MYWPSNGGPTTVSRRPLDKVRSLYAQETKERDSRQLGRRFARLDLARCRRRWRQTLRDQFEADLAAGAISLEGTIKCAQKTINVWMFDTNMSWYLLVLLTFYVVGPSAYFGLCLWLGSSYSKDSSCRKRLSRDRVHHPDSRVYMSSKSEQHDMSDLPGTR